MENTRAGLTKGHGDAEHISGTSARPFTVNEKRKGREKGDKPVEHGERMTGRVVQIFYGGPRVYSRSGPSPIVLPSARRGRRALQYTRCR